MPQIIQNTQGKKALYQDVSVAINSEAIEQEFMACKTVESELHIAIWSNKRAAYKDGHVINSKTIT